ILENNNHLNIQSLVELFTIPEKLEEFDIELLDKMINIPSIESEIFDFKDKPSDLHEDMCAMANAKGGFLVLGIGQRKGKDDKTLIGFEKIGFTKGEEDPLGNKINNFRFLVEPTPTIAINHIYENDGSKFYTVIKIESKTSEKPYFITNTDQCFVRLHSSSQRVGRTAILNLFTNSVEQINNLEKLRSSSVLLRDEFKQTLDYCRSIHPATTVKATPIDIAFMHNAVISNETFLRERKLLGGTSEDVIKILHILNKFNTQIEGYNNSVDPEEKRLLLQPIYSPSYVLFAEIPMIELVLNKAIKICEESLKKYRS
ncbi:MAG: ATP-binding protein, partial [Thaumarchaeota archaeon]|nr:ATP-binding protein [Nitrososphaerota archaeon]